MKRETLHALSVDHALGELPPQVAELLDAYLRLDPAAAREAAACASALSLASAAVQSPPEPGPVAITPAPGRRAAALRCIEQVVTASLGARPLLRAASLAACLALGVVAGWAWRAPENRPATANAPANDAGRTSASITAEAPERAVAEAPASGIWSLDQLTHARERRQSARPRTAGNYRLIWDSPVRRPLVEELP